VTNTTSARIGTGSGLSAGSVSVSAQQAARTTTTASGKAAGSTAAIGAALALAIVDDKALATTARDITATGAVNFAAAGLSASTLTSEASAAGAKDANDADAAPTSDGESVDKQATTQFKGGAAKQQAAGVGDAGQQGATNTAANNEGGRSASTSEGKVSVAASVAINVHTADVQAVVPDGVNIVSGGMLTVQASAAQAAVLSADGQAVKGADGGTSQVGIGVAVSVNVLNATNTARLGAGTHSAAGLSVRALRFTGEPVDTVTATAKSGAGGSKVGIAGSVALNIVTITSRASVAGGASVALGAGASRIDAEGAVLATAKAEPSDEGVTGGQVGVGASFAMNLITTTTEAVAEDGATLTAGAGLAVSATSDLSTVTEASAGAAGGIAVDASVALALLNQTTTARIGTGNALSMGAGAISVAATGTGTQSAKSTGENKSGKVGVGASAAIILGNGASDGALLNTSTTTASLARSVTAAGSLAITAASTRTYDAHASATAGGGVFSQSDQKKNDTTGGTATSSDSLDKTKDSQRDQNGNKNGSKVTVAAAAGIATAQDAVTAELGAGLSVTTAGAVTIGATNTAGVAASGSGVAENPQSKVGIGVGVGLGILNNKTAARVGNGASITAGSVAVTAASRENADGAYLRRLTALGISGATGSSVAVAGSLAVGISTGRTDALLGDNVTVTSGGAVALSVDNTSQLSAKALAGAATTGSGAGVGASIAVVVSEKEYGAGMGANANITAGSLAVTARNHRIDAGNAFSFVNFDDWDAVSSTLTSAIDGKILGDSNYYVEAIGGAASQGVAVQGSFGVMVFGDTLAAGIGANSTVNAGTGTVELKAEGDFFAQDVSGALAASTSSAAVGVSSSVIVSSGVTTATLGDGARITSAGAFDARAQARQDIWVLAASASAASSAGVAGVATVITSSNRVEALMGRGARVTVSGAGAVALNAKNDFDTFSLAAGLGAAGTAGVGAAASVVTVNNITRAALADGTSAANRAEINTAGAITIAADATASGRTYTAAGGAAGTVGAGAGAGVYVLGTTTEARAGDFAKLGNAFDGGDITVSAKDISTLLSVAGAAGVGGTVGGGAGVAIGVITKTTGASIGANALVRGGNVTVAAESAEDFDALTAAVGVGGKAGIAGAVTVLSVTTNTTARIGAGADVLADGNVAVTADGKTEIDMIEGAFGGGTAGVGASVGVTVIDATTLARIDTGADVTALGNRAARDFTRAYTPTLTNYGADEGFKAADFDASEANVVTGASAQAARDAGLALLTRKRGATAQTGSARGVIVNAAAGISVRSLTVAGSAGAVGVSLSAGVPVITTDTRAQIGDGVRINKGAGAANVAQDVTVAAASDMYTLGFSGAVAAGGVGIGAGVNVAVLSTTTEATVGDGGDMEAEGDVLVTADSTQDIVGIGAAGAAAGGVALAGGVSVLDVTTVTTARLGGTVVAQGNAEVLAQDETRTAMLAGAVAVGTTGIGAAVSVVNLDKDVTASVAAGASVSALGLRGTQGIYTGDDFNARRSTSRGLNVQADSSQQAFTLAVAGAAGGVGLSGVVAVSIFDVTTQAIIGDNAAINTFGANAGANAGQDVAVSARDNTATAVLAGSAAVGSVGISGALDVGIFKTTTAGHIGDNVTLNARRDLFVNGLSNRAGNSFVLGAGGGLVGLAAGIAVYNYGDGIAPGGEADKEIGDASSSGTLSLDDLTNDAQSQARNGEVNDLLAASDDENVRDISARAQTTRNAVDIKGAVTSTLAVPAGTSANIGSGTMNVGGTVDVNSSDVLAMKMTTGAVAGGGLAAGAGIGILTIDSGSTAQIVGGGTISAGGLNLRAGTTRSIDSLQFAGSAGLAAALSADVGIITDRSRTLAAVRGRAVNTTGAVAINAVSTRSISLEAKGGGLSAGVAVGASVGRAELGGSVRAELTDGARIGQSGARASSITLGASANDTVDVDALAAGGGVGAALQGAAATARVTTSVATRMDGAEMFATNLARITASATGSADARATGFALAGLLAAGGSLGDASVGSTATVTVTNNSRVDAGSIGITATLLAPTVKSFSSGSAGALVGVNATVSKAATTGGAETNVAGSRLISGGNASVTATSTTTQLAEASGLAVGIVAAGLNAAEARSTTTTRATLTDMAQVGTAGLFVTATGTDTNNAQTTAGSGGVIAGAAAKSDTISRGTVQAGILGTGGTASTLDIAGLAQILAQQNTVFGGFVDSRQASLAGFSGANLRHTVNNTVTADIGDNVTVNALDFEQRARNIVNNPVRAGGGRNVDSVSAGLADVPSGGASVSVIQTTRATIGADAVVNLTRPTPGSGLGLLQIEAFNSSALNQRVNLDSGGAIAVASAEISAVVTATASVTVGDRARLEVERGDIAIAAWGSSSADLRSSATTYGLAGAPSGKADLTYTGTNSYTQGANALVQASDGITPLDGSAPSNATVRINVGRGLNGARQLLDFNATVDLFNKTAIPIPSAPNPTIVVNSTGTMTIGTSSTTIQREGVRAAGDIFLVADRGQIDATARGTGKDIYREALAEVASAISNAFGGGDVTFDYHGGTTQTNGGMARVWVDGRVETGIQRSKEIIISAAACEANPASCVNDPTLGNILISGSELAPVGTEILARVAELRRLVSDYAADPIARAAFQNEISFLERKLAALGLGSFNAAGTFVPGAFAGPSPRENLLTQADGIAVQITAEQGNLSTAAVAGVSSALTDFADTVNGAYLTATFGISAAFDSAVPQLRNISTFNPAVHEAQITAAATARDQGRAAAAAAKSAEQSTLALRAQNVTETGKIAAAQAALSDALLAGNAAEIAAQNAIINNAASTIRTNLNTIASNAETIRTQSAIARDRATTVRDTLNALISLPNEVVAGTDAEKAAINARNANNNAIRSNLQAPLVTSVGTGAIISSGAVSAVRELRNVLATEVSAFTPTLNTLNSTASASAGATGGVQTAVNQITTLTTNYTTTLQQAASASTSSGTPTATTFTIADTAARLGNISVEAAVLTGAGTGRLLAPGNASIRVQNDTSHTIKLGNMLIPDYDAGNLRLNGVLVNSEADITRLNIGGVAADFTEVVTSITSSRGLVEVISNYNPDGLALGATPKLAPDIILETGKVINNLRGAVNITSEAGNIYIRGAINAGSVNILAKNGDFVSSFVNGFNHIGGDPASFSNPANPAERGKGITANGAISISARFLNINSTIQSGIAEWDLTLTNGALLTAAPEALGLTAAQITTAITAGQTSIGIAGGQTVTINTTPPGVDPDELKRVTDQYKAEVVVNPDADPVRDLTINGVLTQVNIKDYLSGSASYRLEFTRAAAEAFVAASPAAEGSFSLIQGAGDNIGALYDARNRQFVINGTNVKGGYVQLFGQIMNTSTSGGQVNVLDGFGTINVTNSTSIPVILRRMSTGEDASGTLRGTEGVIELTDVTGVNAADPLNPIVTVRRTTYTRSYVPGQANGSVQVRTQTGTIRNSDGTLILNAGSTTSAGDRSATYTPSGTQRYVWTEGEEYRRVSKYTRTASDVFGAITISNITQLTAVGAPQLTTRYRLADGTYMTTASTLRGGGLTIVRGAAFQSPASASVSNSALDSVVYTTASNSIFKPDNGSTIGLIETYRSGRSCTWYTACIAGERTFNYELRQEYTTFITQSLKANQPIAVNFIGSNTGSINVTSNNANVVLTNALESRAGSVTINAGPNASIIQGDLAGTIRARQITLDAGRNVGGMTNPLDPGAPTNAALAVNLLGTDRPGAFLTARAASGNVSIIARGDLVVDQVTAGGNVTAGRGRVDLVSFGGIDGRDQTARVQAQRVTLTALGGGVGGTGDTGMLRVNTGFTANPAERPFGDPDIAPSNPAFEQANALFGLSINATGDIGIRSDVWAGNADGTMLVVQARSTGGDVRLLSTGQILDNNPSQTIDQRTYDELLGFWESLGLLADDAARGVDGSVNEAKQDNMILAFENSVTQSYSQYWSIRQTQTDGGASFDASYVFTLSPDQARLDALRDTYRAEALAADPAADADAIAARRLAQYEAETAARRQSLLDFYRAEAVADGAADPDAVALTELGKFEQRQTEEYRKLNETVGGLTADFTAGFRYTATDAEKADLVRGSVWTERELAFSLAPGALKTVTGTNPVIKEPNVAGRSVTIEAGRGIGETIIDPTTGLRGVSILSSTDPRNLTLDQRVALAAAERSDLLLTVGPVRLPANATPEQIAAFDAAVAQGLDAAGSSTSLELGAPRDSLTARQQAALTAAANGLVAPADTLLTILSTRPLNFDAATSLTIDVPNVSDAANRDIGAAFVASRSDAVLARITTFGETRIKVQGNITNAPGSSIVTGNLILEASRGGIGTQATPLNLAPRANATTTARAQNGVFLNFAADGVIDTVYSPQNVVLRATGSLLNANDDALINVLGAKVSLDAGAAIGTVARALNVAAGLDGAITAQAVGDINLFGPLTFRFVIGRAEAGGTIRLTGALDTVIDGLVETPGDVALASGGTLSLTGQGDVHAVAGQIGATAAAIRMLTGAKMRADAGRIVLAATGGNAQVTGLTSGSGNVAAVSVTATGRILAGNADPRTDITATAAGAGVFLSGAQGVGDRTQANATLADATVSDVANPLRIRTNAIAAESSDGALAIAGLGDAVFSSLTAPRGSITATGEGTLAVTTASSGGSQSFGAPGAITFGTLTTTGLLPADPGDVTVISGGSSVTGGSVDAAGTVRLNGTTVGFTALKAGVDATATASTGPVSGGTVDAGRDAVIAGVGVTLGAVKTGRDAQVAAGTGTLALSSVDAGQDARLTGTGVTFTTLKTGQDSTVDAGTGTVAGTGIDAGRDSIVNGIGVTLGTVKTGQDSTIDAGTGTAGVTGIDAGRDSIVNGVGVTLGTVKTGQDSTIDAGTGTAGVTGIDAGRDSIVNGIGVTLGTVKTGQDSTIDGKTGAVRLTRIDAGRTSTIFGAGVFFDTIIAGTDSLITSTGDIIGELEEAGDRIVNFAGFGAGNSGILDVKIMRARLLDLQSTGALTVGKIDVGEFLTLRADDITALDVTQVPAGPPLLNVTLTGANDTVATRARVNVDAPFGLVVPSLKVSETTLTTTANFVNVQNAEIPLQGVSPMRGTLVLSTPSQVLFVDNRSQTPKGTPPSNLQVFEPTRPFAATLNGTGISTDSYVVIYDPTVQVTNQLGLPYDGISLVRDTVRNIRQAGGPVFLLQGAFPLPGDRQPDDEDELEISDLNDTIVEINGIEYNVYVRGTGPAVLLAR
jgi:hypothetical protein